jgi:intein/homing endonuclease
MCYQITKDNLWLAAVGVTSDWSDLLVKDFKKEYPKLVKLKGKFKPDDVLFNTELGELARIFSFVLKGKTKDVRKIVGLMLKIKDPYEILEQKTNEGKELYQKAEKLKKKYERLLKEALKMNKRGKVLVFRYSTTDVSFTAELANELIHMNPDKVVMVAREAEEELRISMRSGEKGVNLPKILEKVFKEVDGNGGGHCLHSDTLLQLSNGEIKRIEDYKDDKFVVFDFKKNKQKINKGKLLNPVVVNRVYDINASPYKIRTSANHRFFAFRNNKIEECFAKNLRVGDFIIGMKYLDIKGRDFNFTRYETGLNYTYNPIKIPSKLTKNLSQLFGYLIGDGCIYHTEFEFKDSDYDLLVFYQKIIKSIFGLKGRISKVNKKNCFRLRFKSSLLVNFFERIASELFYRSYNLAVPMIIQKSKPENIVGFLKGIFDAEGHISNHHVELGMVDKYFLRQLQLLLLRLGIISQIFSPSKVHRLIITDFNSIKAFSKKIGFSSKKKRNLLEKMILDMKNKIRNSTLNLLPLTYGDLVKLCKEYNVRGLSNVLSYPKKRSNSNITYYSFEKILDFLKQLNVQELVDYLNKFFNSDILWCRVKDIKINNKKEIFYDINVPKYENYIANGLIVHNSHASACLIKKEDFNRFVELIKDNVNPLEKRSRKNG